MEFFDKLRLTLSSPLKSHSSDSRDFKTWTLPVQNFKIDNIRLLLYRDCDKRGRKCLFDSAHVVKDAKTGKFQYLPVSNTGQVKDLSEWIFGCVPLSSSSTKRFHRWKGNFIWSKTFQAPATIRNRSSNSTCRNVYSGSSSCLSSNGDLTSSGYVSSSTGIDDSSYDQSSTDSSRNWSLPIMNPNAGSEMKMSNSLPSRLTLEMPSSKILLGLAIVISTGDDDDDDYDDKDKSREICDRKQLPTYITCISSTLELSTDWFSMISIQSHLNPPNFVETLYNFSEEFRQMFHFRLTTPLANINNIPSTVKYLPSSIREFLTVYMTNDLSWTKCYPSPKRCRIVLIGSPKKIQEVKSIFTLLKLINQCSCTKSVPPPITPPPISSTLSSSISQACQEIDNNKVQQQPSPSKYNDANNDSSHLSVLSSSSSSSSSLINTSNSKIPAVTSSSAAITICIKSSEESPTKDEIGLDVVNLNPESLNSEDFMKKPEEDTKFLTRESTKDSGISSVLSSTTSLKRSSTSRKFVGNLPSSIDSLDNGKNNLESDFGVYFHLGEESDNEQTFNNLGLSEPNIDKLKPHCSSNNTASNNNNNNSNALNITPPLNANTNISSHLQFESGSEGGSSSNSNKISPINFNNESLEENYDSFDMLDDVNNILSSNSASSNNLHKTNNINDTLDIREPINVELNNVSTAKLKIVKFCTYCDSVSVVDKFNPLFQIQWLKCSSNSSSSNTTTSSNSNNNSSSTTTATTTTSTSQSDNTIPGDSFKYLDENWILYNLDKHIIKFFDGNTKQETNFSSHPPSDLVKNLIEHVQVLMNNSKESEVEQFTNIQLDFIKKLGQDFGKRLMEVTKFDVQSMPYVGENDLNLLFAIATSQFHELNQRFFV